jgi:tetratricopeptide (TPR) repeat protein
MMNELNSKELFKAGIKLLKEKKYWDALSSIKIAIEKGGYENVDEIPPLYLSYLGLSTALAEKKYRNGATICEKAIKKEFYNPVFYLNLGKVYAAGGYKLKAINTFNKGLKIDGSHNEIIAELKKMGLRRKPIIPLLTRTHVLNKYLGLLLHNSDRAFLTA